MFTGRRAGNKTNETKPNMGWLCKAYRSSKTIPNLL